jgi:hypothetical protein
VTESASHRSKIRLQQRISILVQTHFLTPLWKTRSAVATKDATKITTKVATIRFSLSYLGLLCSLLFVASCQQLDPRLNAGGVRAGSGGSGGAGNSGTGGDLASSSCNVDRMRAYAILQLNCASCHQDPAKLTSINAQGPFNFVLDLDKIVSDASPVQAGKHYVVKGDPNNSLLHQRYSLPGDRGGMPPAGVVQRPSEADLAVLDDWISRCIGDLESPAGWAPSGAGEGTGDGGMLMVYTPACDDLHDCPNGGCCVFSQCVPNGNACGPLANPTAGMQNLGGLPGVCNGGSCQKNGASCGKVGETCCAFDLCTAPQSSCLLNDLTKCSQCGGTGEPCCKPNGCISGRTCLNGGVGRVGTCAVCGALGGPCCGTGVAAVQKCDLATTTCVNAPTDGGGGGASAICVTCGGAGQPCCRANGVEMCNGTLGCVPAPSGAGNICLADAGTSADAGGD